VLESISKTTASNVAGVIFISRVYPRDLDPRISNETTKFISPPIMSIINNLHAETFANYSWNTMNASMVPSNGTNGIDPPVDKISYTFEYKHEFIDRCYLLGGLRYFKLFKGIIYFGLLVTWTSFVWFVWGNT
jgi:hypothetical protein